MYVYTKCVCVCVCVGGCPIGQVGTEMRNEATHSLISDGFVMGTRTPLKTASPEKFLLSFVFKKWCRWNTN